MPKLIIDNIAVEVPEGTNVLEAARSIGITIPHFCWHPALGKAGACRVCAVKMLEGPVKGLADVLHAAGPGRHGGFHDR